jgi:hypothetical protein
MFIQQQGFVYTWPPWFVYTGRALGGRFLVVGQPNAVRDGGILEGGRG